MNDRDPDLRRNAPPLQLHVPEPAFRPGDTPDFTSLNIPAAGEAPRPARKVWIRQNEMGLQYIA